MPGPDVAVARIRAAVRDFLRARLADGDLAAGDLVLVACSGGPDSTALAAQTALVAPRLGVRAGAVVVDHGWRPDGAAVAELAARTCRELGLDPVLLRTVAPAARATETVAREVRYAELEQARLDGEAVAVLLGHTADDQAESVLLAAGRGAGTRSLAGMAATRDRYWRPLLEVRRADTRAACEALGLAYDDDPSNAVDGPWRRADGGPVPRSAVRDRVLGALADALGRDPTSALARTARLARADAELLDELAGAAWDRCLGAGAEVAGTDGRSPEVLLLVSALGAEPEALRTRVLHRAARAAGSPAGELGERHVRALDALVTDWRGQGEIALPGRVVARRVCGRLVLRVVDADPGTDR